MSKVVRVLAVVGLVFAGAFSSGTAAATSEFPAEIVRKFPNATGADCVWCHQTETGGLKTVTKSFGIKLMARGLKEFDIASLDNALDAVTAETPDIKSALESGMDPNTVAGGASMLIPEYGCSASPASSDLSLALVPALAAAFALGGRRKRSSR